MKSNNHKLLDKADDGWGRNYIHISRNQTVLGNKYFGIFIFALGICWFHLFETSVWAPNRTSREMKTLRHLWIPFWSSRRLLLFNNSFQQKLRTYDSRWFFFLCVPMNYTNETPRSISRRQTLRNVTPSVYRDASISFIVQLIDKKRSHFLHDDLMVRGWGWK